MILHNPHLQFGAIEADGERVVVHVKVTVLGLFERNVTVAFSEDDAQKLIAKVQTAIAGLNRNKLAP